ncbi:hypothetical protein Tco_0278345 [Tanacetum coccineum]
MILVAQSEAFKQENILAEKLHGLDQQMERKGDKNNSKEWNSGGDQLRLRWMIYLMVLADAAESVRDAIGFEYYLASSIGWTKSSILWAEIRESSLTGLKLVQEMTDKLRDRNWKLRFEHLGGLLASISSLLSGRRVTCEYLRSELEGKWNWIDPRAIEVFSRMRLKLRKVARWTLVLENIDAYRGEGMGDVIFGKPFLREVGIKARRFEGMITIYNGGDEVTYQMVRSHPRFKHHTNEQCNKIPPLLKVSEKDEMNGISHAYQKLKGFYKGVLNLGPDYIQDERTEEWLTRGHISVHEMGIKMKLKKSLT